MNQTIRRIVERVKIQWQCIERMTRDFECMIENSIKMNPVETNPIETNTVTFILFYNGWERYDNHIITYNVTAKSWSIAKFICSCGLGTGIFGNFYPHAKGTIGRGDDRFKLNFKVLGKEFDFPTSEHAFQSCKCSTVNQVEPFSCPSLHAGYSFKLGRKVTLRQDWEKVKVNLMQDIVLAKFSQNAHLSQALVQTNDACMIEHTPFKGRDKYWADDCDGTGLNHLGQCMVRVRNALGGQDVNPAAIHLLPELYKNLSMLYKQI
jgi:ribA/ribD-fused uncharacterized protein